MGGQAHVHADTYIKCYYLMVMEVNFELIDESSQNLEIFGF